MRADPSPALDDEYTRLSNGGDILITRADVLGLGRDPSTRARASPSLLSAMNLPPSSELYFAQLDGFHQIHCLDMLRRHIYWDVYYAPKYGRYDSHTPHELHWTHVSHCLNVLFENLKCNADANIITSVWMEGQGYPYPDFDVVKKCGDFEGLLDWSLERSVPESLVEMMRMPVLGEEGWERVVKAPEELYRAKGVEFPEEYVVDHEVGEREFWYSSW
jgi:hypothetical protein